MIQGEADPDGGEIIIGADQGTPGNNAVAKVPDLASLAGLPQATVMGSLGSFVDDDGPISALASVPASFLGFASSIATCIAPSCDGITPRVVSATSPDTAFPTFGGVAGGFEVHISEGYSHVDVLTAEDDATNQVLGPVAAFIERNTQ